MVIVLGSINIDLIAEVPHLPRPGETIAARGFVVAAGGKGANQALAAARAGGAVRLLGAVGRDPFAAPAMAELSTAGVDLRHVSRVDGPTGTALILVGEGGENVITIIAGANAAVSAAALSEMPLGAADVLICQCEVPLSVIHAGLSVARARGARTMVNFAPFTPEAAALAPLTDIAVFNETEFAALADAMRLSVSLEAAGLAALAERSGGAVVVTRGAAGVMAHVAGQFITVPALPVAPVDTVGAGDTFCGYLAAGLAEGLDWAPALRRAAAAASLACTKRGAQPSIPLVAEVEAALEVIDQPA